jgi:dolichol kinase
LCILGVGLLPALSFIPFNHYAALLIILPPVLTITENVAVLGIDNLAIPIVAIAALQLAAA